MKSVLFTSSAQLINHIASAGIFEDLTIAIYGSNFSEAIKLSSEINGFFTSKDKQEFSNMIQQLDKSSRCLAYGCGYIFSTKDIEHFDFPILNFHTGKIPQNRGKTPLFWDIVEGRDYSHATLHAISNEIDRGRVLDFVRVSILPEDDPKTLANKLLCRAMDKDLFMLWMLKDKSLINAIKFILDEGTYKKAFDPDQNYKSKTLTLNEIYNLWRCYRIWGKIFINGKLFSMIHTQAENGLEKIQCIDGNVFGRAY